MQVQFADQVLWLFRGHCFALLQRAQKENPRPLGV